MASCEIISQLRMVPTAAYNLVATGTPDSARQEALERAKAGERITPQVAAEIIDWARSMDRCDSGTLPAYRLKSRLARILERYRQRWDEKSLGEMAEQLCVFAVGLKGSEAETQKKQQQGTA